MASKFKVAIILLIIGGISGFLIWGTNELTFEGIRENRRIREEGYYKEIFDIDENVTITFTKEMVAEGLEEVVLLDSSNEVIGYIYKQEDSNAYGKIVVLAGITNDGVLSEVIISSSTNTPTYVKGVKDDDLPLLSDQNIDSLAFDGTSGASFTYGSVKKVVKNAVSFYETNRGDE